MFLQTSFNVSFNASIAGAVNRRETGWFSVLLLWFANGCWEFAWAWKETCHGRNVLISLLIASLSLLIEDQYLWLSPVFIPVSREGPSVISRSLAVESWCHFHEEEQQYGDVPTSKRTVLLICSVLSCLLNFDLGKRNAEPEASRQNSRKDLSWEIYRDWPKPGAWEGK